MMPFERIAPWLIGASFGRAPAAPAAAHPLPSAANAPGWRVGVFLVGVYGGYFGAAAGVVLLALLLIATRDALATANAFKNVLLGLANAVAALSFIVLAPVKWAAAAPLAVGLLAGGGGSALVVGRYAPADLPADADRHRRGRAGHQARGRRLRMIRYRPPPIGGDGMAGKSMDVYLNDHLAGSTLGLDLAKQIEFALRRDAARRGDGDAGAPDRGGP